MEQQRTCVLYCCGLVLALLFSHPLSGTAQEVEDEREFDYIEGSEKGPAFWGDIKKEWADCKTGSLQSPIDMSDRRVKMVRKTENIKRNYRPFNATVKNRGHDIMVQWEGFDKVGSIQINGTRYFLQQCHWHSPSEHSINGRRYSMELHMLHTTPDQKIAVIGYLYRIGKPDAFLSKLLNDIMSMTDQTMEMNLGIVDPKGDQARWQEILQIHGLTHHPSLQARCYFGP
ncbi:hypothetical protein OIU78_002922 [Salix suchowensis]|nr:hypothetical protein OIU78_002922 [Salix suchowensis]KAJ6362615.1 hypothetical protein OIU78_002922 [Salix suchowensis]